MVYYLIVYILHYKPWLSVKFFTHSYSTIP